jgi:hypothetical protein
VRIGTGSYQQCGQQLNNKRRKYGESVACTTQKNKKAVPEKIPKQPLPIASAKRPRMCLPGDRRNIAGVPEMGRLQRVVRTSQDIPVTV